VKGLCPELATIRLHFHARQPDLSEVALLKALDLQVRCNFALRLRLPVSELLITSTLATAKPRAEAEAEADSEHFDTFGTLHGG
jgi:hypothetical protein